jgi:DNA-directed RNA polymerase II subunit RPB1
MLFSRQPSLHKMRIMGHKAEDLDWLTFRLNLSCTSPSYAGDETNLHEPQSLPAQAKTEFMMLSTRVVVSCHGHRPRFSVGGAKDDQTQYFHLQSSAFQPAYVV